MANYKYNQITTTKFSIKGTLTNDGKGIKYINDDKDEKYITIDKCFSEFCGLPIELSISLKTEQDLSDEIEED